jgi:quercetin dioxygenase-like cupin family protein
MRESAGRSMRGFAATANLPRSFRKIAMSSANLPGKSSQATDSRFRYDSESVEWKKFITEGCFYRVLHVDVGAGTAEMLVKFSPGGMCMYHRHQAVVSTMVLEGELRIFEQTPNGEVVKIKPAGSYSVGGKGEIHIEGGGEEGAIVYFNMRTDDDVIYETLDKDLNLVRSITVADFDRDWRKNWLEKKAA